MVIRKSISLVLVSALLVQPSLAVSPKKSKGKPTAPAPERPLPPTAAVSAPKMELSQAEVERLVLKQSDHTEEANLTAELPRKALADVEKNYEWNLDAESGYQDSRIVALNTIADLRDRSWISKLALTKAWTTGTQTAIEWDRNSLAAEFNPTNPFSASFPAQATQDVIGLTLSQSLWKNMFGSSDRAAVNAQRKNLESEQTRRGFNLQNLVLDGLRKFWAAYKARENLRQAIHARDDYKKLVDNVRRKSGYGYSVTGELSQAEAELETRVQNLKNGSVTYIQASDDLLTYLNLAPGREIDFKIENIIPTPPTLKPVELEKLREFRSQVLKKESADLSVKTTNSLNNPDLALVAQLYGTGVNENSANSFGNAASGSNPKYFLGLKLTHNFGSNTLGENQLNAELQARIEQIKLDRLRTDLGVRMDLQEKKVQAAYAVVLSARDQLGYREKAEKELQASYRQGRTGIRDLILAMNDALTSEVAYSESVGNYQIALAEWAALRDELIPEGQAK